MTYKTVAMIVGSTLGANGVFIYLSTTDERERRLQLNVPIHSANPNVRRIAEAKLAQLCQAVGVMMLTDTEDLNGLELLVEYRANGDIVRFAPLKVVEYKYIEKPRRSFWQWLFRREPE